MKKIFGLISIAIFLSSCSSYMTQLQDVEMESMPNKSSIKITKDEEAGQFVVRGNFAFNRKNKVNTLLEGHSLVNEQGIYELESVDGEAYFIERAGVNVYPFEGDNLRWNLPDIETQFEFEYNFSKNSAIFGGTKFAESSNRSLFSYNLGLGFFREEDTWAIRFDMGAIMNQSIVKYEYVAAEDIELTDDNTRKVFLYSNEDKGSYFNPYFSLTINTRRSDWPANGFFSYILGWQNFYGISTEYSNIQEFFSIETVDYSFDENYNTLAGGLFTDLPEIGRLILGARYTNYTDDKDDLSFTDFFMQFDFAIF